MSDLVEVQDAMLATSDPPTGLMQLGRCPELAKALALAQQECGPVPKDSRNNYHNYSYASAENVIVEAKRALAKSGLALLPVNQVLDGWEREGENRFELRRHFLLLHSSGESVPLQVRWPVVIEKGRPLDKAVAIAATTSLAYLLRDLLMMPRVNPDDMMDSRDDRPQQQAAKPPPIRKPADNPNPQAVQSPEQVADLLKLFREYGKSFFAFAADSVSCMKVLEHTLPQNMHISELSNEDYEKLKTFVEDRVAKKKSRREAKAASA